MQIRYDVGKIKSISETIHSLLHLSTLVLDGEGNVLAMCKTEDDYCSALQHDPEISRGCQKSDAELVEKCKKSGKVEMHLCHVGLCDLAVPVFKNGVLTAFVLVGRIRVPAARRPAFGSETDAALYELVPFFTEEQLENLKFLLSNIIFDAAITVETTNIAEEVASYIQAHLDEELSIPMLCKRFFVSKNTLYKVFNETYGGTVGNYISDCRLAKAKELLVETNETVLSIGDALGFDSYAYFCRLFKSKTGLTPSGYRKKGQTKE